MSCFFGFELSLYTTSSVNLEEVNGTAIYFPFKYKFSRAI